MQSISIQLFIISIETREGSPVVWLFKLTLWSVMIQGAEAGGLDVVRHGERCSGKSKSATAAAARKAVRSAPKAKYGNTHTIYYDGATVSLLNLANTLSCFWLRTVCGLQFGRALQIKHSRQPRHRLHQELRSVSLSSLSSIPPLYLFLTDLFDACSPQVTARPTRVLSSGWSMWEPLRSYSLTWARPSRSLWTSSVILMLLR